jgi:hypothetical protein
MSGRPRGAVLALAAALLVPAPAAVAAEIPQELDAVRQEVERVVDAVTSPAKNGGGGSADAAAAPAAQQGSGSTAGGAVVDVSVGGQPVLTVGETGASAGGDGSSADATLLAVAGHEVIGAHAGGGGGGATGITLEGLCSGTDGLICAGLLFADAATSQDGSGSTAAARMAAAFACIGGGAVDYGPDCTGPITVTVASGESFAAADGSSSQAAQQTEVADVCLGPEGENADGVCSGIGLTLLHAESSSSASGDTAAADGDSYLVAVDLGGEQTVIGGDEESAAVPPDCPPGQSVACIEANQGEATAVPGTASAEQETVEAAVAPGAVGGADLVLAFTPTAGTTAGAPAAPSVFEPGAGGGGGGAVSGGGATGTAPGAGSGEVPGALGGGDGGDLAFTGSNVLVLLGLALGLALAGAGALALQRRVGTIR